MLKIENKELSKTKALQKKILRKKAEFDKIYKLNLDLQVGVIEKSKEHTRKYKIFLIKKIYI